MERHKKTKSHNAVRGSNDEMPELWKKRDHSRKGVGPESESPRQNVRVLRQEVPRIHNQKVRALCAKQGFHSQTLFFSDLTLVSPEEHLDLILAIVRQEVKYLT